MAFGAGGRYATGAERFRLRELRVRAGPRARRLLQRTSGIPILTAAILYLSPVPAPLKVESSGQPPDTARLAAVRSALDPKGMRLTLPEGAYCELWLRKSIPDDKRNMGGALAPGLAVSTEVGVIRFVVAASDFRGQAIKPGIYTLRYAIMPSDGAHMGASEYPDYLLVIPADDDPDPDAVIPFAGLMDLSRKATGTRHPGVFSLTRPSGTTFPAATMNDQGHVVLQVKARLRSGTDAPIALVVKGRAEQ
jgi:hypothetical protein